MTLLEFLSVYQKSTLLKPASVESYKSTIASFNRAFPGFQIEQFSIDHINQWIHHELQRGNSPHTVRSDRMELCTLWRAAYERDLAPPYRRPMIVRAGKKIIRAFPPGKVGELVAALSKLTGRIKDTMIPRGLYWSAFVALSYETALRTSDLLQLRYDASGHWVLHQVKTGRPVTVECSQRSLELARELSQHHPRLFALQRRREWYCRQLKEASAKAGIPLTPQQLRQSAASECERLKPNTAWIMLGHSSPQTTQTWYLDQNYAYKQIPHPKVDFGG